MVATPNPLYRGDRAQEVFIALRELLSRNQHAAHFGLETLSDLLYAEQLLSDRPKHSEVEAAREALLVEGEVLA